MTTSDTIAEAVDRIVRRFDPERVILFGSRARGDHRPDSDIDLLVVLSACDNKREAMVAMLSAMNGLLVSVDVIVTTPDEIAREGHLVGTVLRPALREGKVVYERS